MNLRWLKQNLVVVIFSATFVVVLLVIILMERKAATHKDEVVAQLEQQQADLNRLRNLDPTPANENIEALRHERQQVQHLNTELQKGAVREPVAVPDMQRDIEFLQLMRDTIGRLNANSARSNVRLADNFAFGFSRYDTDFPCRQPAAKGDDCRKVLALLAKQLLVVEKLSGLLIDSHADEIVRIRRTEVEPGAPSPDSLPVPIGNDPKVLYKTFPFEFEFSCDTDALRTFLNSLTQSDWFFAVRSVKIEGGLGDTGRAAADAEAVRTDRRLLRVIVRIDLVEFEPPAVKKT